MIQSAKYLGVAPWELLERERFWMDWAKAAEMAEADARRQQERKAERKRKRRSA